MSPSPGCANANSALARIARRSPQTSSLVAGLCALSLLAIAVSLVEPVASQGAAPSAAMQLLRTSLTATLAVTLLTGPGIAIRAWRPDWLAPMTYLTLPGLALLIIIGLADWLLTANLQVSLPEIADPGLVAVVIAIAFTALRRREPMNEAVSVAERQALVVYAVVLAVDNSARYAERVDRPVAAQRGDSGWRGAGRRVPANPSPSPVGFG
jgi:hypothetical protein